MIIKQELFCDKNDAKGAVTLRNTIDCQDALDLAREATQSGGGRAADGSMVCMGHIPPEYWSFDPWLIAARRAQRVGDRGKYFDLVRKFFELNPAFKIVTPPKYYQGVALP